MFRLKKYLCQNMNLINQQYNIKNPTSADTRKGNFIHNYNSKCMIFNLSISNFRTPKSGDLLKIISYFPINKSESKSSVFMVKLQRRKSVRCSWHIKVGPAHAHVRKGERGARKTEDESIKSARADGRRISE